MEKSAREMSCTSLALHSNQVIIRLYRISVQEWKNFYYTRIEEEKEIYKKEVYSIYIVLGSLALLHSIFADT